MSKEEVTRATKDMMEQLNKAASNTQVAAGLVIVMVEIARVDIRRDLALAILPQFEAMAETYRLAVVSLREAASMQ